MQILIALLCDGNLRPQPWQRKKNGKEDFSAEDHLHKYFSGAKINNSHSRWLILDVVGN